MKIVMIDNNDAVVSALFHAQEINFDSPAERKRVLIFILDALCRDRVGRWFDKDREREDPND